MELDDDAFAVREKAMAELEKLGRRAESALRKTLVKPPSVEVQRRVERLLEKMDENRPTPEHLRSVRSLEVLEHIGTSAAQQLVQTLAKGARDGWLTQEAKAILERFAKRQVAEP
jgi:hypothetical protein